MLNKLVLTLTLSWAFVYIWERLCHVTLFWSIGDIFCMSCTYWKLLPVQLGILHSSFLLYSEWLACLFLMFHSLQLILQFPQFLFLLLLWPLKVFSGHISEILRTRTTKWWYQKRHRKPRGKSSSSLAPIKVGHWKLLCFVMHKNWELDAILKYCFSNMHSLL